MDPSHCWDHRRDKVTEHHSCQSSHVNGAIAEVGVNLVAFCWLLQSCPSLNLAKILFRSFALAPGTVQFNNYAWNEKVTKDVKDGQLEKAMHLFQQMQQGGMSPDKFTFVQVIKARAGLGRLEDGRLVHKQLIQSGYKSDVFVCNSLVDMYAKCGILEEAWTMFEKMPSRNVVTWTPMILRYVQCRQGQKALELFEKMQQEGVQPDSVTFVGVMNASASILALEEGRCVHQQIVEFGWHSDMSLWGIPWLTYMQNVGALKMFRECSMRCHFEMWSFGLLWYCDKCGQGTKALELFQQIQQHGVQPNNI